MGTLPAGAALQMLAVNIRKVLDDDCGLWWGVGEEGLRHSQVHLLGEIHLFTVIKSFIETLSIPVTEKVLSPG